MDILLTFTGFHDPYTVGLVGDEEQPGPILSLVKERSFDQVYLFSTPNTEKNTTKTKNVLESSLPDLKVVVKDFMIDDPTNYFTILKELREHIKDICNSADNANYFVAVTSGTPQMHACLVLLVASGEIPAHIINVRPPRFVTKEKPLIDDIDLSSPEFPSVRSDISIADTSEFASPNLDITVRELGLVCDHRSMRDALEVGAALAPSEVPILILGETGTGKELFAQLIHKLSGRPVDRFVPINCASIPKELVESIMFGHKKGSFTGAVTDQIGKFDSADGGTLFLDELAELPMTMQAKLLRVLQDGFIEPIGVQKAHKVNVRIIAATNKDLGKVIKNGKFREDLYFRLNVGNIQIPPLRKRRSDIPKIALHVLDKINKSLKKPKRLTVGALSRLQNHSWPGNVRDLENVIERSVRLVRKDILDIDDLLISEPITFSDPLTMLPDPTEGFSLEEYLASVRKQLIFKALESAKGNQSEAARLLGISPQAVHKFLRKSESNLNQG